MSKKESPIHKFDYRFTVEKRVRVFGFSVPEFYSNSDNALLDVEMIMDFHDVYNSFEKGTKTFNTEIIYIENEEGQYEPKIGELRENNLIENGQEVIPSFEKYIIDTGIFFIIKMKIKHFFKRNKNIKTKRS